MARFQMEDSILIWIGFFTFILAMLALDLGVFHRKSHAVGFKEAMAWCGVWVSLALVFNGIIYFWRGPQTALQFLTGYLIEYSLSVDNIFVFLLIFTYFKVPAEFQHRVLFWGILGALVLRAAFIALGITLIQQFHWMIYVFGLFLIVTGVKMALQKGKELHPEKNPVLRMFRKWISVTEEYDGEKFFVRKAAKLFATPLAVVLLMVETSDVIFAIDSIPAILAITTDPFIVFTSNVFAILGLRSLYFALSGTLGLFHHLHYGLSFILGFVGVKMVISGVYVIPVAISLGVISGVLVLSILASIVWPDKNAQVLDAK